MRKDRVYKLNVSFDADSCDINGADCGCPGGRGPSASCKHIAALCYAFLNFCELGSLPDFLTCTDRLQEWNRPRKKNLDPIPVTAIREHQQSITCPSISPRCSRIPSMYDPRPQNLR
uniref:SWIM-type domain-containing protein n=1 Tax=Amphimedon queenslandica TaxID=400682 RepID=A0A1X7TMZ8_AMPQE